MPDIYKYKLVEEEEESVLIPDVWLPCDERREQEEAEQRAAELQQQREQDELERVRVEEEAGPLYSEEEIEQIVSERVEMLRGQLRQQVYEEVRAEVTAQKSAEVQTYLETVDDVLIQMQQEQFQFMEQFRDRLAALALDIAEKLVRRKIAEDDMFLSELVTKTVGALKTSEWVTVEVSDQLVDLVTYLRTEFKKPEYGNVEVAARYYPDDTCILETDGGVIDASISAQVANVKKEFDAVE